MAWYDSIGNFGDGGGSSDWLDSWGDSWSDSGGGGSVDWGDLGWGDWFEGGDTGGEDGGGGFWAGLGKTAMDYFGGGQGSGGENIFGAMLAGLGGAAQAFMDEETVKEAGKQKRRSLEYSAGLTDYYTQIDKQRKRTALDTYGQFSLMDRWAPNAVPAPPVQVPNKPSV